MSRARLILLFGLGFAATAQAETYQLYFLGGQSNMEGYGFVEDLPDEMSATVDGVRIFTGRLADDDESGGGVGVWDTLAPGHGTGFQTDGSGNTPGPRFGPELTFGRALLRARPDARIAIVKYAKGGSGLGVDIRFGDWDPDYGGNTRINQYDHALTTIRNALSAGDIDGDGEADQLIPAGIVWMQGETDAGNREAAAEYEANLKRMMNLFRAALRKDGLPVVIGRITDSGMSEDGSMMDYIDIVQRAQADFVAADECAAYVSVTDEFGYPADDPWHYTSEGFIQLGSAFAQAALELTEVCGTANSGL